MLFVNLRKWIAATETPGGNATIYLEIDTLIANILVTDFSDSEYIH